MREWGRKIRERIDKTIQVDIHVRKERSVLTMYMQNERRGGAEMKIISCRIKRNGKKNQKYDCKELCEIDREQILKIIE